MEDRIPDVQRVVDYWIDSAKRDNGTMKNLLKSGDRSWALFMGHLVLEKLLKAHYVKTHSQHAIFTHDLLRLASRTDLSLTDEQTEWLDSISTFNINARYDSYKQDFFGSAILHSQACGPNALKY